MIKQEVRIVEKDELITEFICKLKLYTLVEYKHHGLRSPQTRFILNKLSYKEKKWLNNVY